MSTHGASTPPSVPTPSVLASTPHELDGLDEASEVRVYWQDTLLHTSHLSPPRPFVLGGYAAADLRLDEELLGQPEVTIPSAPGRYEAAGLTFIVRRVSAARRLPVPLWSIDWRIQSWTLAAFAACAVFLLMVAMLPPNAFALSLQNLSADTRYPGFDYLRAPVVLEVPEPLLDASEDGGGEASEAAPGEPGQSGDRTAERSNRRRAQQGPAEVPTMTREQLVNMARTDGLIGILRQQTVSSLDGRYVADQAIGASPESAQGAVLGDLIGSNYGIGGLAMRGTGAGQRADANGTIGVGALGTRRGCAGTHCGSGPGVGVGMGGPLGGLRRDHKVPPHITSKGAEVRGSLSRETIRRVISRQLKRVRFCYEQGLQRKPDLAGRVAVKFIIDPSGMVKVAAVTQATLGDAPVEQCIAHVIRQLNFPAPGGIVSVTYPFTLEAAGR